MGHTLVCLVALRRCVWWWVCGPVFDLLLYTHTQHIFTRHVLSGECGLLCFHAGQSGPAEPEGHLLCVRVFVGGGERGLSGSAHLVVYLP